MGTLVPVLERVQTDGFPLVHPAGGCPDAVCILMFILLPGGVVPESSPSGTQVISWEPSPHLNWSIKARACNWAVRSGREGKARGLKKRWKKPWWTRTTGPGETASSKVSYSSGLN